MITIFNSIILSSCCYLEVQSSLGKLSKTVSKTGFSAALLLQLRIQPHTSYPSPRDESESVRAFAAHSRVTVGPLSAGPPVTAQLGGKARAAPRPAAAWGPWDSHSGEAVPRGELSLSAAKNNPCLLGCGSPGTVPRRSADAHTSVSAACSSLAARRAPPFLPSP